ncbi:MAG: hypothetical protein M1282_11570 [Chloroflexi bacterium]|nr:hypothetical protein [Chloroflexota bacterium]
MFFDLFESLLVTAVLAAVSAFLPGKWFREGFVYKAVLVTLALAAGSILLQNAMLMNNVPPLRQVAEGVLILALVCAVLILLFQKILILQKTFVNIIERFEIFAYIYIPLGVIGSIIVLIRNLFQWQR